MKDLIFISHSNPQDNYFSAWLASKLILLGYNAWVDIEDFRTGDAFFTKISPLIKDKAVRFIAVNSESYIDKAKNQNTGVSRELNTAITVTNIDNFILPIRIDNTSYSDFPSHYASWNAIDFNANWQNGLIELVNELERSEIEKVDGLENPINTWYKVIKNENKIIEKEENYFSNWFSVDLPDTIYIHWPENITDEIYDFPYPFIIEAKRLITFASKETTQKHLRIRNTFSFPIEDFQTSDDLPVDQFVIIIEPKKKLVKLMNNAFKMHLDKKDLSYWHKRGLHYFKHQVGNKKSVSLRKRFNKTSRTLSGIKSAKIRRETQKINWHYAINGRFDTVPFIHYKLYYTLTFTDAEGRGFGNNISLGLRRSVPADWYNRKWYEMLLASMLKISESEVDEYISIEIDENRILKVLNEPIGNKSSKGYLEP
ncbi:MAG: toll/interleukin-1 receptor domain-containing protein [Arenibacter algicola]